MSKTTINIGSLYLSPEREPTSVPEIPAEPEAITVVDFSEDDSGAMLIELSNGQTIRVDVELIRAFLEPEVTDAVSDFGFNLSRTEDGDEDEFDDKDD